MPGSQIFLINTIILSALLCLSGCIAPVLIGGAAAAGMMATKEKGIGGTFSDSAIGTKVKMNLYNFNRELHAKVSVTVQNKEVLLTGIVEDASWPAEAERLAKSVEGVNSVINNITTEGQESLGSMTSDSWITTRIRSALLFENDLYSLNYSVETIDGVVYLTGIGQDEAEISRVTEVARNVGGVKKVVSHVKIKGQERTNEQSADEKDTDSSPASDAVAEPSSSAVEHPVNQESTNIE